MAETVDLLFFDTFAHENSEELNLDLVQFPKPVYVTEVRIIPLGARVQADFPGGVRLGATNPSQFSIEFFVNDLGKPGASTFESLGGFEYNQNGCINLECVPSDAIRKIPTDGLVLRGWYTTITLAVYGILTANIAEQILQPVVTPSIPPQSNALSEVQQIMPVTTIENEWNQENAIQTVPMEYSQQAAVAYPQTYGQTEQFPQEYTDYYGEVPKDPRSFHNTPESDWDNKSRGRSIERERDRERDRDRGREADRYQKTGSLERDHNRTETDRRDRDRHYSRSRSQDKAPRDFIETSRDRDRDWEHEHYRDHPEKDWGDRDRDRDRGSGYKQHQDSSYRRPYGRDDREDIRKRPRTPPVVGSPKRPHTPHVDHNKDLSPAEIESFAEPEFNAATAAEKQQQQRKERGGENQSSNNNNQQQGFMEKSGVNESQEVLPPLPAKTTVTTTVTHPSPTNEEVSTAMDVEEFEPILSDEDILDDTEHFQDLDYDYTAYTNNDDLIKLFVPGLTTVRKYRKDPNYKMTDDNKINIKERLKTVISITDDFFRSSITKYSPENFERLNSEIKEEFIHLCEKVAVTVGEPRNLRAIIKLHVLLRTTDISELSEADKEVATQITSISNTLIDWIRIALDFDMANMQNQPAYKIRHIKCGVRLAEWCCNSADFIELLWEQKYYVHEVLLSLYNQEYMALSIKLMILTALDTYLLHKSAIECFISGRSPKEVTRTQQNGFTVATKQCGYKILIEHLLKNCSVRLKFSLRSILRKLNTYEVLAKLHATTTTKLRRPYCDDDDSNPMQAEHIDYVVKCADQILQTYQAGLFAVSQPKRFLPVSAQFEIVRRDVKNVYVLLFEMHRLLDCFVLLLTHPDTMNLTSVRTPIYGLLAELLQTQAGLDYLVRNCDAVNVLLKCLLRNDETARYPLVYSLETRAVRNLGLRIAYGLQCKYHVDCLLDVGDRNRFDCDDSDVIDQLHGLYCLTLSSIGKNVCCKVLGFDRNIESLLQFVDLSNLKEKSEIQTSKLKKSPGMAYVIDLIALTVIYDENVHVFQHYSKQLLSIIDQRDLFETSAASKIDEFAPYVKPFENLGLLGYDNINPYMELIVKHSDSVTTYPGQLITSLRVLQHLGISRHNLKNASFEDPLNNYTELKYKHVVIQLFSLDGVSVVTKILQRICAHYEQPSLHAATTFVSSSSNQGFLIVSVVRPCVDLLRQMLTYVIQCRNTNYKDLTAIPVLLRTYNLMRTFPSTSPVFFEARKLCRDLVDTLLVYTQPVSEEVNEKDSLNKTLWTLMCGEVIKYVNFAPYTFVSGLLIFSELLPLPLPVQSREPLTSEEVSWAVNLRKLWSAHLHVFSSNIQELINRLCTSTHPTLLGLLRKVCIQLSDLAANSAVMIARGILDTVHADIAVEEACNGNTARLLNLLACLVMHGSLKCAVLHLLNPANAQTNVSKGDEKYPGLIQAFAKVLALNSNVGSHIQAQECILSIIQSLCDTEITLLHHSGLDRSETVAPEVYLANSLPTKENLLQFITMMIEHLVADNSLVTYLLIVRTLLLLTEHDYGFYHLREYVMRKNEPIMTKLLDKLVENYSKDNEECLSTLNALMEFLRVCLVPDELPETTTTAASVNLRTMRMSVGEIKLLIGWRDSEDAQHPLCVLDSLLKKSVEEDKAFEKYLLEGVGNVLSALRDDTTTADAKETYSEPILPIQSTLLVQFAGRPIFTLSDIVDEQLTSLSWLSVPSDEGNGGDAENVTCDLTEICRQNLPAEINLVKEVEKLCRIYPSTNTELDDNTKTTMKGTDVGGAKDKIKKTFVTPAARRGFPRTVQARADLFRSRPPNTSRPPSLHVDDFVALETCGAQPTGPTGYNKISRELLATTRVTRGTRGRPFVTTERAVQYRQMWVDSNIKVCKSI